MDPIQGTATVNAIRAAIGQKLLSVCQERYPAEVPPAEGAVHLQFEELGWVCLFGACGGEALGLTGPTVGVDPRYGPDWELVDLCAEPTVFPLHFLRLEAVTPLVSPHQRTAGLELTFERGALAFFCQCDEDYLVASDLDAQLQRFELSRAERVGG